MIVTLGAIHRQSEKCFAGVFDCAVEPSRAIEEVVVSREVSCCCEHERILRSELVSGKHLANHLVVTLIVIERIDDPVSPVPEVLLAITKLLSEPVPI